MKTDIINEIFRVSLFSILACSFKKWKQQIKYVLSPLIIDSRSYF